MSCNATGDQAAQHHAIPASVHPPHHQLPTAAAATQTTTDVVPSYAGAAARHSLTGRWLTPDSAVGAALGRLRTWAPVRLALDVAYGVYFDAVVAPLFRVYMLAPRWGALGGWYGKPAPDVCSELTPLGADYWWTHPVECESIVWHRFESWLVALEFLAWLVVLLWLSRGVIHVTLAAARRLFTLPRRLSLAAARRLFSVP